MVRVIAEAQATVVSDLRQIFIVKFFQAYVLGRPEEETRSESKDRAPERPGTPGCPAWVLVLRRLKRRPCISWAPAPPQPPAPRPASCRHWETLALFSGGVPHSWSHDQPRGDAWSLNPPPSSPPPKPAVSPPPALPSGSQPQPRGSPAEQSRGEGSRVWALSLPSPAQGRPLARGPALSPPQSLPPGLQADSGSSSLSPAGRRPGEASTEDTAKRTLPSTEAALSVPLGQADPPRRGRGPPP